MFEKGRGISLLIVAVALLGILATGTTAAYAALAAVGPVDPANGFPKWYQDSTGLRLVHCLTQTGFCITSEPNPALPISFPDNFGDENFYFLAETSMDVPGGTAFYRANIESAFANGAVVAGDQIVFARIRIRIDTTQAGTFTVTHPYGRDTFVVTTPGIRAINFTSDVGIAPGVFTGALAGRVGPFLQSATGSVTDALGTPFLANPFIPVNVTGSPFGTNFFQVDGPDGRTRTNLFNLMGQIFVPAPTTTGLATTPNPSTAGQAVTLAATVSPVPPATGVPDGTVTFIDGATTLGVVALTAGSASLSVSTLAVGTHSLTAVYSGSADFKPSTSAAVIQTVNAAPPPPPGTATDTVTIARAEFRTGNRELRVEGTNTRITGNGFATSVEIHDGAAVAGTCPGTLIGSAAVGAADGRWRFRGTAPIPSVTTVCVNSAGGGVASRATVVTP